ncbi:hypothetical protein [Aequorivita sp. KMM 9714]|uniref:hypothetical protein n=1 Tax=Aequorivita sp. KMM 9714 TaxID=2707173 RepID=UPI0013EA62B9|nr:hypothetical protein [Aequorivita sp. KMM 9714]NGX84343.1 hypothetical protein [Aequorivita sp. KMM 9714]
MNLIKNFKKPLLAIALAGAFTACSDDDDSLSVEDGNGKLGIYASANYSSNAGKNTVLDGPVVELSKFLINLEEIELEYDDIIGDDNFYNSEEEIELKGPFELDLLSPTPVVITIVDAPNGRLEEIEFEFDKNENPDSEIYEQSIRMEGTIDGVPFVFWHDFEEELEVEFDEGETNTVISNDQNSVVINFDLNSVFDATTGVDLSNAVDGNGDGVIEISPNDEDGNRDIADAMKEHIKDKIDLLDD